MLKQQNHNSLLLTEDKNNTVTLIGINSGKQFLLIVHSISWMILLNMPIVPDN